MTLLNIAKYVVYVCFNCATTVPVAKPWMPHNCHPARSAQQTLFNFACVQQLHDSTLYCVLIKKGVSTIELVDVICVCACVQNVFGSNVDFCLSMQNQDFSYFLTTAQSVTKSSSYLKRAQTQHLQH